MQVGLSNLTKQNTQKPCKGCLCNLDLFRFRNQMSSCKCLIYYVLKKSTIKKPGKWTELFMMKCRKK
jgi:hypothetical protein